MVVRVCRQNYFFRGTEVMLSRTFQSDSEKFEGLIRLEELLLEQNIPVLKVIR